MDSADVLDDGDVGDSFDSNMDKIEDEVEAKAKQSVEFAKTTRKARRANAAEAQKAIEEDKALVANAYQRDEEQVEQTRQKTKKAIKSAAERVAAAKEDA